MKSKAFGSGPVPPLVGQFPILDLSFLRPKDERGKRERKAEGGKRGKGEGGRGMGRGPWCGVNNTEHVTSLEESACSTDVYFTVSQ